MSAGITWAKELEGNYSTIKCNRRQVLAAADISLSGSWVRLLIEAPFSLSLPLTGCSIGLRSGSSDDFSVAPTRITFNGGSNGAMIGAGGSLWSDWIEFPIDESQDYLVHLAMVDSNSNGLKVIAGSEYVDFGTSDQTMEQSVSYSPNAANVSLAQMEVADSNPETPPAGGGGSMLITFY